MAGGSTRILEKVNVPSGLHILTFKQAFQPESGEGELAQRPSVLTFDSYFGFKQNPEKANLPSNLQSLTFGTDPNESPAKENLPSGPQSLACGRWFDKNPGEGEHAQRPSYCNV